MAKGKRSPLKAKPLRNPGQSLDEQTHGQDKSPFQWFHRFAPFKSFQPLNRCAPFRMGE